ncbi:tyrosine-type recombinase/integrase [Sulfurimonas sp.]|uniref:tyrosine-type recombinase/integrase n=1 Tax=Sulfurimonas sp. TaxID=2022749 RepID=UPI0025F6DA64|nr:tyrosine-type recombinase/integrase [Sulfurimonas sp.]
MARVITNTHNIIVLDKTVKGKRHRLSTGVKADRRSLKWYEKNSDDEFHKLYNQKFSISTFKTISFKEYGENIIRITGQNRNEFSQREEEIRFKKLCGYFGDIDISDIRASLLAQWQDECGLAPKTIRNYRSTLNTILEMAMYDEIISKNPLHVVKVPMSEPREVFVFNTDEIEKLIRVATNQFKNILQFNFFAGLRGSELIALRWNDIDFDNKTIRVDTRIREGKEDVTKSKRIRILDMLPQAEKALRQQQKRTGLKEHVFITQYGTVYKKPNQLNVKFQELCMVANLKVGTFKTTRKSYNTLLKQYGMPQDWILDQLGHTEDAVNREHYTGKIKADLSKVGTVLAHL